MVTKFKFEWVRIFALKFLLWVVAKWIDPIIIRLCGDIDEVPKYIVLAKSKKAKHCCKTLYICDLLYFYVTFTKKFHFLLFWNLMWNYVNKKNQSRTSSFRKWPIQCKIFGSLAHKIFPRVPIYLGAGLR